LKSSTRNAKLAGGAAKLVGNIAGGWLGGWGGKALQNAGKTAGDATAKMDLGKPPKNRLVIIARMGEKRHKILFDTIGQSRPEMEDDAKSLYKQILKARGNPGAAEAPAPAAGGAPRMAPAAGGAGWSSAPAVPGKPFRVLRNGQAQGPFSLEEV